MPQLSNSIITLEQLGEHNSLDSLWIGVHGNVYDLTTFGSDHPGGIEELENCAGIDGTEAYEYAGHSEANTAKLQQYRIGSLGGGLGQESSNSHDQILFGSKRTKGATSYLNHLRFSGWRNLAATLAASIFLLLSYQQRTSIVGFISPRLNTSQFQFRNTSDQGSGLAFWTGTALASSVSGVCFGYLYKLLQSTLDYQNEVFSLPPTIPRKTKRRHRIT